MTIREQIMCYEFSNDEKWCWQKSNKHQFAWRTPALPIRAFGASLEWSKSSISTFIETAYDH